MCEELFKTSLSIVEVLSQHHALTSPHHRVVSIPSSVLYEAMNYSFIPFRRRRLLSSFRVESITPVLYCIVQESEDLPVTNPLLIQGTCDQIPVRLCVSVHMRVC